MNQIVVHSRDKEGHGGESQSKISHLDDDGAALVIGKTKPKQAFRLT